MNRADPRKIIREVIEAHGGEDYWNRLDALDAEISASGLLFSARHRQCLDHVRVRAWTREPRLTFFDFPHPEQTSNLVGETEVNIMDSAGHLIERRSQPRAAFTGLLQRFYWDDLHFAYFGGYATWNYLTIPFLFLRPGFTFELLAPLPDAPASWSRVQVIFPPEIPTHSRTQIFHFDENRLLRRLDYTASVIGNWANAAHLCQDYRTFGSLLAPTRRRVQPLMFGKTPLPWPTLVALDIHDIQPVPVISEP